MEYKTINLIKTVRHKVKLDSPYRWAVISKMTDNIIMVTPYKDTAENFIKALDTHDTMMLGELEDTP